MESLSLDRWLSLLQEGKIGVRCDSSTFEYEWNGVTEMIRCSENGNVLDEQTLGWYETHYPYVASSAGLMIKTSIFIGGE